MYKSHHDAFLMFIGIAVLALLVLIFWSAVSQEYRVDEPVVGDVGQMTISGFMNELSARASKKVGELVSGESTVVCYTGDVENFVATFTCEPLIGEELGDEYLCVFTKYAAEPHCVKTESLRDQLRQT